MVNQRSASTLGEERAFGQLETFTPCAERLVLGLLRPFLATRLRPEAKT